MFDFAAYLQARDALMGFGAPFTWLLLALAATHLALRVWRPAGEGGGERRARMATSAGLATLAALAAGFAALGWYHLRVRQALPITDPFDGTVIARYALPLWIEGEKLYFWALLAGILVVPAARRHAEFAPYAAAAWTGLIALSLLADNPFTAPLPRFHAEVDEYRQYLLFGDAATQAAATRLMLGRLYGFYNSTYMWVHPPLLFASYAAFLPSFLASALWLRALLRAPATPAPSLQNREGTAAAGRGEASLWRRLSYGYARLGYLFLTAGLLIGYPWTRAAWRDLPWWWDPKINMSLMMWVLYTAFLHTHLHAHRPAMARLTAGLGVVSFLALVATYLTTYLIPGVHSYR